MLSSSGCGVCARVWPRQPRAWGREAREARV